MEHLNTYKIPHTKLSNGEHSFVFAVDDAFFAKVNQTDYGVKRGNLNVEVHLTKKKDILILDIFIEGTVNIQCDRCLDYFDLPIEYRGNLYVEFGEETSDLSDIYDSMVLAYTEDELDLSQHIYEYVNLSLPYSCVHPEDENGKSQCNQEMLKKLDQYLINDEDDKNDEEIDPRWEKLKSLMN